MRSTHKLTLKTLHFVFMGRWKDNRACIKVLDLDFEICLFDKLRPRLFYLLAKTLIFFEYKDRVGGAVCDLDVFQSFAERVK